MAWFRCSGEGGSDNSGLDSREVLISSTEYTSGELPTTDLEEE